MDIEEVWEFEKLGTIGKQQFCDKMKWSKYMFRTRVHRNRVVMKQLEATGYKITDQTLTQRQVQIICEICGYPLKK